LPLAHDAGFPSQSNAEQRDREKRSVETGREAVVFVRDAARWLIAWRAQQCEPAAAAG
jgi:hypothetical protein